MTPETLAEDLAKLKRQKAKMRPGPWTNEPDRVDFTHAGLNCLLHRNPIGVWCGYVGVPPGHVLHSKACDDVNVDVHGGLTYADACQGVLCHIPEPGEPEALWWFGFDCGHAWDVVPYMDDHIEIPRAVYRDVAYARSETESLAKQIAGAS